MGIKITQSHRSFPFLLSCTGIWSDIVTDKNIHSWSQLPENKGSIVKTKICMEVYSCWVSIFTSGTSSCRPTARASQGTCMKKGFAASFATVKSGGKKLSVHQKKWLSILLYIPMKKTDARPKNQSQKFVQRHRTFCDDGNVCVCPVWSPLATGSTGNAVGAAEELKV